MCGRVSVTANAVNIAEFFLALQLADSHSRYNITPAQNLLAVRIDPQLKQRTLLDFYWGLIPTWAKDARIGNKLSNARGETLAEKPSFRGAFKYRRCLIPVNGFYEWRQEGHIKQPYYFQFPEGQIITFAGLWEYWCGPMGEEILSVTIITTAANSLMAPIHHRMPVILAINDFERWLDPAIQEGRKVQDLIRPYQGTDLSCYPVSGYVNNSSNQGPQCIQPQKQPGSLKPASVHHPQQLNLFD